MPKAKGQHKDKALTAAAVKALRAAGLYADGNGLYLKVDEAGNRRWVQRLVIQGKRKDLSLGSVRLVSLAAAREQALENRKIARAGGNPTEAKAKLANLPTFETAARDLHEARKKRLRPGRHKERNLKVLSRHVFPVFGSKRITDVTGAEVVDVSLHCGGQSARPQTGLNRTSIVCSTWPLRKSGDDHPLTKCLPEFRCAPKEEFDLDKEIWIIPPERMKNKRMHRVPLVPRAIEILREAERYNEGSDLVFPDRSVGAPFPTLR